LGEQHPAQGPLAKDGGSESGIVRFRDWHMTQFSGRKVVPDQRPR